MEKKNVLDEKKNKDILRYRFFKASLKERK